MNRRAFLKVLSGITFFRTVVCKRISWTWWPVLQGRTQYSYNEEATPIGALDHIYAKAMHDKSLRGHERPHALLSPHFLDRTPVDWKNNGG